MALSPQDVQSQQFNVRFRGFDVDEVDAFLERVAEELLLVLTENQQLKERLSTAIKDVDFYKNQEKTFHNAIISTQKIADEILDRVKKEAQELKDASVSDAEKLLQTAREEAEEIRHRSNSEVSTLIAELDRLEQMKNQIQEELRTLLNSYLEKLDQVASPSGLPPQKKSEAARFHLPEDFNVPPPASKKVSSAGNEDAEWLGTDKQHNLSDLYQRIDLNSVSPGRDVDQAVPDARNGIDIPINEEDSASDNTALNLDDDMALSLNDPLDDLETSVKISPNTNKFNR